MPIIFHDHYATTLINKRLGYTKGSATYKWSGNMDLDNIIYSLMPQSSRRPKAAKIEALELQAT